MSSLETAVGTSQVPVSLGKPSLRVRLEAYYSLIDPERLQDGANWRQIFDDIYTKVGLKLWLYQVPDIPQIIQFLVEVRWYLHRREEAVIKAC